MKSLKERKPGSNQLSVGPSSKMSKRTHTCDFVNCMWSFPNASKLERHMISHGGKKFIKCAFEGCEKAFSSKSNMQAHKKLVHDCAEKYRCSFENCNEKFYKKIDLELHIMKHSDATPGYLCDECNCSFFTKSALSSHKRKHNYEMEEIKCAFCGKEFAVPCRLRDHIIRKHSTERPYPCPQPGCKWSFSAKSKLDRHMERHLKLRNYECTFPNCGKKFIRKEHLINHGSRHGKDPNGSMTFHAVSGVEAVSNNTHSQNELLGILDPDNHEEQLPSPPLATKSPLSKSARTCLTYSDVLKEKTERQNNNMAVASVMPLSHGLDKTLSSLNMAPISGAESSELEASPEPNFMMPSMPALPTSDSVTLQDELLTQEYFLLMDSMTSSLSDGPSTINLRDLE